ncbi:recombinase family protein [Acutalibacter muris]|uniref:recombinase family protein n=1 Tax=Acutalibacter muris TaxID=1796620 RepID=UPI001C3EC3EB|nr:recombinase family protein [Acutalibacter muris]
MARTKRKVNPLVPVAEQAAPLPRIYNVGGYVRLSVEDSGKKDPDTIEVQQEWIEHYIAAQPDMNLCHLYRDNGRTGTNFQRPGFERLMEDVRAGKIDCIVVKDLSRFGRNYIETGNYLEQVFPFLGVRFVAINESFDTLTAERGSDGYIVPLKNIINDAYSKDISRKVSSALAVKQKAGEFIGSWAAYGYRKCAEDKHRVEPNPDTAPVVRDIFMWRLEKMSYNKIAKRLNDDGIITPSRYLYQIDLIKTKKYNQSQWKPQVIKSILNNPVYLGHTVQGRKKSGLCQGQKQRHTQKSDWVIVENTHEPLIDEDTFRAVQAMSEQASKSYNANLGKHDHLGTTPNILRGLIFCADCGRPLVRYKSVTNKGTNRYYVYICPSHSADITACPKKYIHENELKKALLSALCHELELCADTQKLIKEYSRSPAAVRQYNSQERNLTSAKQALARAKSLYGSLYQNYVDRLMDEGEYVDLKRQYRAEIERAQAAITELEQQQFEQERRTVNNPWLKAFSGFQEEKELTDELAHALIERVEVHSDNRLEIKLKYRDEYEELARLLGVADKAVAT